MTRIVPRITRDKKEFLDYMKTNYQKWFTEKEVSYFCEFGVGHCVGDFIYITENSFWLILHEYIHFFVNNFLKKQFCFIDRWNDKLWNTIML